MDLKNMLSSPSEPVFRDSVSASDLFDYDIKDLYHISSSSSNLPPIQHSGNNNTKENFKVNNLNIPECLEPIPLAKNYHLQNILAPTTIQPAAFLPRDLPFVPSSSSSCSSESSGPSSPQLSTCSAFNGLDNNESLEQNTTTSTVIKAASRHAYLPYIQPMPVIEEKNTTYSISKCPMVINHDKKSTDDRNNSIIEHYSGVLSPTMTSASATAIAVSNKNQARKALKANVCDSPMLLPNSKEFSKRNNKEKISFSHPSSFTNNYKQQQSSLVTKSAAADQLMFLTKNDHIKRPCNAWIHFRCHYGQALKSTDPALRAEEISKRASRRWACLSDDQKKPWHNLAEQDKQAHKDAFPGYKYCPRRSTSAVAIAKQKAILNDRKRIKPNSCLFNKFNAIAEKPTLNNNKMPLFSSFDPITKSHFMN